MYIDAWYINYVIPFKWYINIRENTYMQLYIYIYIYIINICIYIKCITYMYMYTLINN